MRAYVAELVASGNRPRVVGLGGWTSAIAPGSLSISPARRSAIPADRAGFASTRPITSPRRAKSWIRRWAGHRTNRLANEGRGKGITLLSASQRPQKVHKDYLTSHETLIAMRVIHPLDRRVIEDWIDGFPDQDKETLRSLASLKRGGAWVWSPKSGSGPKCIEFPLFATYDSFAPPGENAVKLKRWPAVAD
jgi:uncharacterized protein